MKKFISGLIVGTIITSIVGVFAVNSIYENPYPIFVNGEQKQIQGYNVDDYSYFKLRDIADAVGDFTVDFQNDAIQIAKDGYVYENLKTTNILDSYTPEQYKDINIFLSNFSEALFPYGMNNPRTFDKNNPNYGDLINFAYIHNLINNPYNVGYNYDTFEMYVTAEATDKTIDKYFGITLPHESAGRYVYRDGKFFAPAASGEGYCYVSVAKNMTENSDGTLTVDFSAFTYGELADIAGGEWDIHAAEGYWSTYYNIINSGVWKERYSGTAVVRRKEYEGKQTYELISYNY